MRVILTVVGSDRPGLTQALADAVLAAEGNWLESHLARLGGKYVGSVLVEVPAAGREKLEARCRAVDAEGLRVTLVDAGEAEEPPPTVTLELIGRDRPGIVREISAALAGLGVNIEALETDLEREPWSGDQLFRLTADLRPTEAAPTERIRDALEAISADIMVDFNLVRPLRR
jgi:glycine cleavage system regulatory protein